MSTQVQYRRGTAAQHATFVGAPGEITVDTTNNTLRVHDGVTPGGHPLTLQSLFNTHLAEGAEEDVHGLLSRGKIIEESGNNANGSYVRFADGTQICRFTGDYATTASTDNFNWIFPAAFITTAGLYVHQSVKNIGTAPSADNIYIVTIHSGDHTTSVGRGRVVKLSDGLAPDTGTTLKRYCYAIGRWK